jgi:hypothetical protein
MALVTEATQFLQAAGYAASDVVAPYRFTWRTADGGLSNGEADVVAFSGHPHTLETACLSVVGAPSDEAARPHLSQLSYLSSPVALVGTPTSVSMWGLRRGESPELVERVDRERWTDRFRGRLGQLGPERLVAAKTGAVQLSFVDPELGEWALRTTSDSLVRLLEKLLEGALHKSHRASRGDPHTRQQAVMRCVFQLFACRVLEDTGVIPTAPSLRLALQSAHEVFSDNIDPRVIQSPYISEETVDFVTNELRQRFAFASLTTDMLGHAYENALITPSFRKQQGIYYTPASVTRYVLNRLPIESIERENRFAVDPACGSGSFLLAAFHRLGAALPATWTPAQRHQYLRARISGFDTDDFAREIAVLSLLLVDLRNKNGWKIRLGDATELDTRAMGGRRPTIVVTNPPFAEQKSAGVRRELAAEILLRIIKVLAPGGLLGVVLPQSLLESRAGTEARASLLRDCELLEIATLPAGVFVSRTDTAVVLARKPLDQSSARSSVVTVNEVTARELGRFQQLGLFTRTYSADVESWRAEPESRFTLSPLAELWQRLESLSPPLKDVAIVRTGLQVKATDTASVSDRRRQGDVEFVDNPDVLRPFALLTKGGKPNRWLRYGPHLHRPRARDIFEAPKVLVNANRNPGSAWRLIAALAPEDLYYSLNFHGIRSKVDHVPLELIAAVLNSPVANAWLHGRSRKRWIVVPTLELLPFPVPGVASVESIVKRARLLEQAKLAISKSDRLGLFDADDQHAADVVRLTSEIDEAIYDAYGMTKSERRSVEKLMSGDKRPL